MTVDKLGTHSGISERKYKRKVNASKFINVKSIVDENKTDPLVDTHNFLDKYYSVPCDFIQTDYDVYRRPYYGKKKSSFKPLKVEEKQRKVQVTRNDGTERTASVKMISLNVFKEWLGGFRDKRTRQEFHNAQTQTKHKVPEKMIFFNKKSVNVQAHLPLINKQIQNLINKGTQMSVAGIYLDSTHDRYLTSKPYRCSDCILSHEDKIKYATLIQRWFRKVMAARRMRKMFEEMLELLKKRNDWKKSADEMYQRYEFDNITSRAYPYKRDDFFMLYSLIGEWWSCETSTLEESNNPAEKISGLYYILLQLIDQFYTLETQRIKSKTESLQRIEGKMLEDTSRPIIRDEGKCLTLIETLDTQRAKEIKEIFVLYKRRDVTKENRIDFLLSLKSVVETFKGFDQSKEFIEFINEEILMMNSRVPDHLLEGLRKRGEECLLSYIRNPEFNHSGENYRSTSFPRVKHRGQRCMGCLKFKIPSMYPVHVRLKSYTACRSCQWMFIKSKSPKNLAPYSYILKILRADEASKCSNNIYCNLIQPIGAHHIVTVIWNGHSALSEVNYVNELRLVRWDQSEIWSPWNCIVLTQEEALIHAKIKRNEDIYEDEFIQSIKLKHYVTKIMFKDLMLTQAFLTKSLLFESGGRGFHFTHTHWWRKALNFKDPIFNSPPFKKIFDTFIGKVTSCNEK